MYWVRDNVGLAVMFFALAILLAIPIASVLPQARAQDTSGGEMTMFEVLQRQADAAERAARAEERQAEAMEDMARTLSRMEHDHR